jgi:hypothetical protein
MYPTVLNWYLKYIYATNLRQNHLALAMLKQSTTASSPILPLQFEHSYNMHRFHRPRR